MRNDIKIFLSKLALIVAILVLVDFAAGWGVKYLFDQQKTGKYYKITHAIKDAGEDILIFGNSHAAEHFDAPLMQQLTSKTVFNFGSGGQTIFYTYPLVKSTLNHHSPKVIIVNLDYDELKYSAEAYSLISIFLPYHGTNATIDSAIALMPFNERLKCYSNLYKYNSTFGQAVLNTYVGKHTQGQKNLGYEPKAGYFCQKDVPLIKTERVEPIEFDENKINYLLKLIDAAKSRNIKLLVTTSPLFHYDGAKQEVYRQKLQQILARYNVPYLDYGTHPEFYGKCEYFSDNSHLNPAGASKWTEVCSRYVTTEVL